MNYDSFEKELIHREIRMNENITEYLYLLAKSNCYFARFRVPVFKYNRQVRITVKSFIDDCLPNTHAVQHLKLDRVGILTR